jgi:hypothetical protein
MSIAWLIIGYLESTTIERRRLEGEEIPHSKNAGYLEKVPEEGRVGGGRGGCRSRE